MRQVAAQARAAVIGCGVIATEHLRCLHDDPRVAVVGVCDTSPVTARYASERFGGTPFFDHRTMLDEVRPDVVHVLTPPGTHRPIALDCLAAGAHVVVEKPIAGSTEHLVEMLDAAESAGRLLMESQNMRFNDQMLAIDRLRREEVLGTIVSVEVLVSLSIADEGGKFSDRWVPSPVRGLAGGAIHDFLPHMAYLTLHQYDYHEASVASASWWNRSGNPAVVYDELEALVEVGDGTGLVRFHSRGRPNAFRYVVRGTLGMVETDFYEPFFHVDVQRGRGRFSPLLNLAVDGAGRMASSARNLRDKVLQHTPYHGLPRMLMGFYGAVIDGGPAPIAIPEMLATSRLVDGLTAGLEVT